MLDPGANPAAMGHVVEGARNPHPLPYLGFRCVCPERPASWSCGRPNGFIAPNEKFAHAIFIFNKGHITTF